MNDGYIQRQSDLALIPPTEKNPDYVQYLKDRDAGVEVLPFDYVAEERRQTEAKEKDQAAKSKETLIQTKMRELAIEKLKQEGKLDSEGNMVAESK